MVDDEHEGERGVQWQVALVVVVATFTLVAVSVVGLTRRTVDPFAVPAPTTSGAGPAPSTSVAVDPTVPAPPAVGPVAEDGAPWPSDVALIVANEHGIERVTGEKGEVVVTRVDLSGGASDVSPRVERAFDRLRSALHRPLAMPEVDAAALDLNRALASVPVTRESTPGAGAWLVVRTWDARRWSDDAPAVLARAIEIGRAHV